jgi:hypothetical protein
MYGYQHQRGRPTMMKGARVFFFNLMDYEYTQHNYHSLRRVTSPTPTTSTRCHIITNTNIVQSGQKKGHTTTVPPSDDEWD